jgi:hypothetical protein
MDANYFRSLARRCLAAARNSFDLRAVEEFRKLADEFTQKASDLERPNAPIGRTKRSSEKRE